MTDSLLRRPRRGLALLLPLLAAACTDSNPLTPTPEPTPVEALAALQCTVEVQSATMSCADRDPTAGSGISAVRIFGTQDVNIKLASSGGSYDAGTQIFQTTVTVQNLTQQALGLDSLGATTGVKVFFTTDPSVTSGTGPVSVYNPTGQESFTTGAPQDYFLYNEVLQPNEISSPLQWQFQVPTVSTRFTFVVLIAADQPAPTLAYGDKIWDGSTSTDWAEPSNWEGGVVPDSASSVQIPPASKITSGRMPVLPGDVQVTHLNVGTGSSLALAGHTLTAWGNVDALGSIAGGTLWMRGSGVVLGGGLPSVVINGATSLQRSTTATGAVSISGGSLVVNGSQPLSIALP